MTNLASAQNVMRIRQSVMSGVLNEAIASLAKGTRTEILVRRAGLRTDYGFNLKTGVVYLFQNELSLAKRALEESGFEIWQSAFNRQDGGTFSFRLNFETAQDKMNLAKPHTNEG